MKQILSLIVASFLMVGCGGGSNSSGELEYVNNSSVTTTSSSLGYYGSSVKLGNHNANQWWSMRYRNETQKFLLKPNGKEIDEEDINTGWFSEYGISNDGLRLNINNELFIDIKSTSGGNCYNADLTGQDDAGAQRTLQITLCALGNSK